MSQAVTQTKLRDGVAPTEGSFDHIYCCDEDRSLCGLDISELLEVEPTADSLCIVCEDLESTICPDCGE